MTSLLSLVGAKHFVLILCGVQMKNLVHNLPLAVEFQQREQVGEAVPGPVVEFEPHGGDCVDEVDAGDARLEFGRWTILVVPRKEILDGTGE